MKKIYLTLPIMAGLLTATSGIFVRSLTQNGIDPTTLLFLRFSFGILIMLIVIFITDKNLIKIKLNDLKLLIIPAICIIGLNICYNESVNNIPLSVATVLVSTAPIFVIIFAYILFREKITYKKVISIIFVIVGCVLTSGLLEGNVLDVNAIGIIEAIGTAIFLAVYTVASKSYLDNDIHIYTILLYSIIISSIILIPFTNFNQINTYINSNITYNLIFLILQSLLSFTLPYILLTASLNYIDAGITSIFISSFETLAAILYGICFYTEIPTILMMTGIILTILAITNLLISISSIKDVIPFDT